MTTVAWIICERTTRWAAALRVALSDPAKQAAFSTTLHEVRSLTELTDRLKRYPNSLVLIEVTPTNLENALTWLADVASRETHVTTVALFESDCDIVATALREAGASDVIHSPRQIRPILTLGERHALKYNVAASRHPEISQSIEDWAWSLLPWQEARRPLGLQN